MSTVKRTPPKKKQTDNPRQIHTSSESDISSAALTSDLVKMNRNKRPRSADSPQGGSTLDLQNLQHTLSSWREEQDSKLATILADIVEIKTQNTHIKESNDEIRKTNEELKGPYKVNIIFKSKDDAEKFLKCQKFKELYYVCQTIDEVNPSYGVVKDVDLDVEEQEILQQFSCDHEIVSMRRLKRLNFDGTWIDSTVLRLAFKSSTLPSYIDLG
ncbi:unnamed protein product, partial [Arctia plantaginis]